VWTRRQENAAHEWWRELGAYSLKQGLLEGYGPGIDISEVC